MHNRLRVYNYINLICFQSNSHLASITSSPLFISEAESIVIFAPITQLGCFNASALVTPKKRMIFPSEWPAGCGKIDFFDRVMVFFTNQALENSGMLRIYGHNLHSFFFCQPCNQVARHYQGLFIS